MHCFTIDLSAWGFGSSHAFLRSMLMVQKRLAEMPTQWWDPAEQEKVSAVIADREENLTKIKPGVRTMFLIFSSRTTDVVWELPLHHYYQAALDPILEALLGRDAMKNIIRLQLAQMSPGAHIKPHRDSGPWAQTCALPLLTYCVLSSCSCA